LDGWEAACKKLHELCWWPHLDGRDRQGDADRTEVEANYKLSRVSMMDV
jgi:hypothetical protein